LSSEIEPELTRQARLDDPHYRLTLPHLQLLYGHMRDLLVREIEAQSVDSRAARHAIQEAFAAAARHRFHFRSEQAGVSWLRSRLVAEVAATGSDTSRLEPVFEWSDVLRRANIETGRPTQVGPRSEAIQSES